MLARIACAAALLQLLGLASGAVWQARVPATPPRHAHKRGCFVPELDDVVPFGGAALPRGVCLRVDCTERRLSYDSCGLAEIGDDSPNCLVTEPDLSKPYPECCPSVKCEHDNYLL